MTANTKSCSTTTTHRTEAEEPQKMTHQDQELKIKRSTHLCITIRWGVGAAAPASTRGRGDARC